MAERTAREGAGVSGRSATVRAFEPRDRAAVRALCARTAAPFGPLVDDPELAPLLYADSYLDLVPETCVVAVGEDGALQGYALGAADTRAFRAREQAYFRRRLGALLVHHARATLAGRYRAPAAHLARLAWARNVLRGRYVAGELPEGVDLDRYPAHAHLQIEPAHRDGRAGVALLRKLRAALRAAGARGQYASVLEPVGEERYSRLVAALGFVEVRVDRFTRAEVPALADRRPWARHVLVCDFG